MKTIRDPIHNIVQFDKKSDKLLLDLIDTQEFQRLRHIKQLGLASFTYPGAEHTRFAHSLGVTHLMKRFIDKICNLKGDRFVPLIKEIHEHRLLALAAALLHDIGHGPFSHALEKTTGVRHEKWTIAIIQGDTEVNYVLKKHGIGPQEVVDVIQRTHPSKAIVKLLSSQLDTDRIDYLLRDSKMTGAGYGTFDLEWMINVLTIGEHNGEVEVGLDIDKGISIAEDFVMARYYMYTNVYFHKTTRSAELLIDKIFSRALEIHHEGKIDLPHDLVAILTKKGQLQETVANYINLTDNTIWYFVQLWTDHNDATLSDLCSRLNKRQFFKSISSSELDPLEYWKKVIEISSKNGISREYYFLRDEAKSSSYKDSYLIQVPKIGEEGIEREASEQIVLFDKKGIGTELSNISDIVNGLRNKKISIERYFVPDEYKNEIIGGYQYV
ncbi:HD domain-containing protein [Paenibacillaceae bacterium WGS1546]|uniref:HD domain-containing protein n=1 Tax=Cohnella sp. WGS1546 TaxID=3366810 RepID=UPI00372D4881